MKYRVKDSQIPSEFEVANAPMLVQVVATVLGKFMPVTRIRLERKRTDIVGVVRFDTRRVFLLFKNGRWTSTSGEDAFTLGREDSYARRNGQRMHYGDAERALGPLTTLGLITEKQANATRTWLRRRWEASARKDRVEQLKTDAKELGIKVVGE